MADLSGARRLGRRLTPTTALLVLALAACSSHGSSTSTTSVPSTVGTAPTTLTPATLEGPSTTAPPRAVIRVAEPEKGKTVLLHRRERLTVVLHSTYWSISSAPDAKVLKPLNPPVVHANPVCRPVGAGCGSLTARYRAIALGTTTIVAHRDSCGEALQCRPNQKDWTITVTVVA